MALPEGFVPLAVGTALSVVALTIVLSPLLPGKTDDSSDDETIAGDGAYGGGAQRTSRNARAGARQTAAIVHEGDTAVEALREIEFDRATGKLSDSDYDDLRKRYTRAALDELRAEQDVQETVVTPSSLLSIDDAIEAAIQRARAEQSECGVCGPRPEPDAIYCSSCGRYLPGNCGRCGASVELVGSRFCSSCGEQLAAA